MSARAESDKRYWAKRRDHPDARFLATREWRELRAQQLKSHPHCEHCDMLDIERQADQVDHIRVPNGDEKLQRDPTNLMSLCASHHGLKTRHQATSKRYRIGVLISGDPVMSDGTSW